MVWLIATGRKVSIRDGFDSADEVKTVASMPVEFTKRAEAEFIHDKCVQIIDKQDLDSYREKAQKKSDKDRIPKTSVTVLRKLLEKRRVHPSASIEEVSKLIKRMGHKPLPDDVIEQMMDAAMSNSREKAALITKAKQLLEAAGVTDVDIVGDELDGDVEEENEELDSALSAN